MEAGWPGEPVLPDSGANRVYVAVATLRKLGLPSSKPDRKTSDGALQWEGVCGVANVTIYPGANKPVSHVHVYVLEGRPRRMSRTSRGWLLSRR